MNCTLCGTPLQHPASVQYSLCWECRHWPQAGRTPHTDQQHDDAVDIATRILGGTIIEDEAE